MSTAEPGPIWQRLLWFAILWVMGVGCVTAVGFVIRLWLV